MRPSLQGSRRALLALVPAFLIVPVLAPAAARAKPVTPGQQSQVRPGMTADEVTTAIGKPFKIRKYKGGATWGYQTRDAETWFLVDFDADGKVKSAKEQYLASF